MHCYSCNRESAEGNFCNHCGQPLGPPVPSHHDIAATDGKAIGSLICGILSLTIFSVLAGIPAVVLGHISRSEIKRSMGRLKGEGLALAGLIMGYLSFAAIPIFLIIAAIAIPSFLRARQAANESGAVAQLRTIESAEREYIATRGAGSYGDITTLVDAGLLDDRLNGSTGGYRYTIKATGEEYTATALPATQNTGRYGFYVTREGVIRYSAETALAPSGMAGRPLR